MKIIVEVGAHTGKETFNFLTDSDALVFAFEPDQEKFAQLFVRSRSYPRLYVFPFAVDIGDNQEPLFHYEDGLSTLNPPEFGKHIGGFTMTWTIRLDTFMNLYGINKIDYLRIDAPFREEMCLESLGNRSIDVAQGRIRKYEERGSAVTWLYDHGFSLQADATTDNILNPDIRFWRP